MRMRASNHKEEGERRTLVEAEKYDSRLTVCKYLEIQTGQNLGLWVDSRLTRAIRSNAEAEFNCSPDRVVGMENGITGIRRCDNRVP